VRHTPFHLDLVGNGNLLQIVVIFVPLPDTYALVALATLTTLYRGARPVMPLKCVPWPESGSWGRKKVTSVMPPFLIIFIEARFSSASQYEKNSSWKKYFFPVSEIRSRPGNEGTICVTARSIVKCVVLDADRNHCCVFFPNHIAWEQVNEVCYFVPPGVPAFHILPGE